VPVHITKQVSKIIAKVIEKKVNAFGFMILGLKTY